MTFCDRSELRKTTRFALTTFTANLRALRDDRRGTVLAEYSVVAGCLTVIAIVGFVMIGEAASSSQDRRLNAVANFAIDATRPGI